MTNGEPRENFSDFDQVYLEAILTRDVLREADLILILKKFGLGTFEEYSNDPTGLRDACYVLINEVPMPDLLDEVQRVMSEDYIDRLNFDEAREIYEKLKILDFEMLQDFYVKKLHKDKLKKDTDTDDAITLILGELLKLESNDALALLRA